MSYTTILSEVRAILLAKLQGITGLAPSALWPENVVPPAIIIDLKHQRPIDYHIAGGAIDTTVVHFNIYLLLDERIITQSLINLDSYLMPQDTNSVKAALESIVSQTLTYKGTLDWVMVKYVNTFGEVNVNNTKYIGVQFDVDVEVSA